MDGLLSSRLMVIADEPLIDTEKQSYELVEIESLLAAYHQYKSKRVQLSVVQKDEEAIASRNGRGSGPPS